MPHSLWDEVSLPGNCPSGWKSGPVWTPWPCQLQALHCERTAHRGPGLLWIRTSGDTIRAVTDHTVACRRDDRTPAENLHRGVRSRGCGRAWGGRWPRPLCPQAPAGDCVRRLLSLPSRRAAAPGHWHCCLAGTLPSLPPGAGALSVRLTYPPAESEPKAGPPLLPLPFLELGSSPASLSLPC